MIMEARQKRLSTPLQWGRREKTAIAGVVAVVVIACVALGVYALSSGGPTRRDCIDVVFASTLGGADLKACGGRARRVCASGSFHSISHELSEACGRAGFPYKSPVQSAG
jgi:hypothetical protein